MEEDDSEEASAPLELVAAPLGQPVEVRAPHLQDCLELRVRQVSLPEQIQII